MNIAFYQPTPRVLIVDADSDQLTAASRILENAGFRVQTARDARSGIEIALREEPELVIGDVTTPRINGIELCNMIRGNETLSTTPVLLVTALPVGPDNIVEGLPAEANDYLEIPYEPAVLIAKANRLIEVNRVFDDLHKEKERLRFAIAGAQTGLWEWNMLSGELFWSDDLQRIHGIAPGAFGGTIDSYVAQIHVDDREFVRRSLEDTLNQGSEHRIEYRVIWPNGTIHWVEGRGSVIRNRRGKPVQMFGLCMDITERKAAEVLLQASHDELEKRVEERAAEHKKLEQQLHQASKLEAVGRLAGGIAHDFNNLLTAIIGYSQLSLRRLHGDHPVRANVEAIEYAGDRAAGLTRQLLAFSRKQVLQPTVIDLNAVIREMETLLLRTIGEDIDLRTDLRPDGSNILADQSQMEQIIMNLVVNARDAMPSGGQLTLATTHGYLDESYRRKHAEFTPGAHVLLAVSDTGTGMDAETQEHLFEPFFTTKEEGKGTGLGLSTVYGIVKQSGGNISVDSEVGKGSTFKIYFPLANGSADLARPQSSTESPRGTETVLVVEDHEIVRSLVVEVLVASGYDVIAADGYAAALDLCAQHPAKIRLLLTDVVMPGMSGRAVAERLTTLYPELRILYMSGYADQAIVHHGVLDKGTNFIQKPFSPAALAIKVREVLDAAEK